jgi:hypothetical protein
MPFVLLFSGGDVVKLAGCKAQRQKDNDGKNVQAGDADGRALGIDRNQCQRARGK